MQTLTRDVGVDYFAKVPVDASVANSLCERKGIDRIRHVDVCNLWLQDRQERDRAPLTNINGKLNCADLMTKYLSVDENKLNLGRRILCYQDGRSAVAAQLYSVGNKDGSEITLAIEPQRQSRVPPGDCY